MFLSALRKRECLFFSIECPDAHVIGSTPWVGGSFAKSKTGVAGFQLSNGDFGWVQLKWTAGPGGWPASVEALNYAYNTTSGQSIVAGEHEAMALLALGAAGVAEKARRYSVSVTLLSVRGRSGSKPFCAASEAANNCAGTM